MAVTRLKLVASSSRRKDPTSPVDPQLWKWYSALGRGDDERYLPKDLPEPAEPELRACVNGKGQAELLGAPPRRGGRHQPANTPPKAGGA